MDLDRFVNSWNHHTIRTTNRSPIRMFTPALTPGYLPPELSTFFYNPNTIQSGSTMFDNTPNNVVVDIPDNVLSRDELQLIQDNFYFGDLDENFNVNVYIDLVNFVERSRL
jgi:hypothetical protein